MNVDALYDAQTSTLTYVVWDPETRDAVVIDPVLDYDPAAVNVHEASIGQVLDRVAARQLRVHYVLETHVHADHLSGAARLRERLGARMAIHEAICEVQQTWRSVFGWPDDEPVDGRQWDLLVRDGVAFHAGSLRIVPMHTPGHTPACVCYCVEDAVFTGDCLFLPDLGTGRCDFPGGSAEALYDSVQRLYGLPPATRVFVGHDYPPADRPLAWQTTIEACRTGNRQLRADTEKETFVAWRRQRDATLRPPALLFPALQVNARGGRLPEPGLGGRRFLVLPMGLFGPAGE